MLFKNSVFSIIVKFIKCKTPWERFIYYCLPIITVFCFFIVAKFTRIISCCDFNFCTFGLELSNTLIIITSIFITSSIIYMIMLASGGSEGIYNIKRETTEKYIVNRWHNNYFKTLLLDIAYTVILSTIFLCFLFLVKFLIPISTIYTIKFLIGICILVFSHLSLVMLGTVKNIYYTIR